MSKKSFKTARIVDEVRKELVSVRAAHTCCIANELDALLLLLEFCSTTKKAETFRTSNLFLVQRLEKLALDSHDRRLVVNRFEEDTGHGHFNIRIEPPQLKKRSQMFERVNQGTRSSECCALAFLRVLFLRGGYLTAHSKGFHLEIVPPDEKMAAICRQANKTWTLTLHESIRRSRPLFWIKSGEDVACFLGLLGSTSGLLAVEDTIASRSLRNEINRSVNCEVANMKRASKSALKELEDIKFLASKNLIQYLPPSLREVAIIRLQCPEDTLREVGGKLSPPLTKTGIHHRMKRIREAARIERKSEAARIERKSEA